MKRVLLLAVAILLAATAVFGHDLFLKLDSYFLQPNSRATVRLMNGTFAASDGAVARDRLRYLNLASPDRLTTVNDVFAWRAVDKTSIMEIQTRGPGTYLVGASTRPREIALKAADFNDYLKHDGLPDTLAARTRDGELGKDARERYSKHVRAIFQVGDKLSDDYQKLLDYPVELIPQQNPYALKVGDTIAVLCLLEGRPIANQFVMAGWEPRDGQPQILETRADAEGIARIKLGSAGKWFIKFIHMTPLKEADLNYESKWASLTFEIR